VIAALTCASLVMGWLYFARQETSDLPIDKGA
jgi:hypothetical protein